MPGRKPSTEIRQDLSFQHRQWAVQRTAWALAVVVLALAMFGLFGDGPLSHVRAGSPALQVQYDRFIRRDNPAQIQIEVRPAGGAEVRLAVSREYLHGFRIESMVPYPQRFESGDSEVMLVFRVMQPANSARITLNVTPLHAGALKGRIRMPGGDADVAVPIDQFTFP